MPPSHPPAPVRPNTPEPTPSGAGDLARFPDGGYRVTFTRSFDRPASELWLAVTEPPGLDAWYPTKLRHEGVVGTAIVETFEAGEGEPPIEPPPGTLSAYDPPRLFEVTVEGPSESEYPGELGRQVIRMRVKPDDSRSTLVFEHDVETLPTAVAVLPGWHWCLEFLAAYLGQQADTSKEHHDRLREWYQAAYASPAIPPMLADDTVFTTPRLRARRWRDSDLAPLLTVYGDLDAMRWVGDGSPLPQEEAVRWLDVTRANYAKRGYGMFALESIETGEVIGFLGIVHPGGQPEAEVKYAFAREQWGKGLATEAVTAAIAYGHGVHGLTHVIATTAPANTASHRVLIKSGFVRGELRDNGDGTETLVFEWRAAAT